MNKKLLIILLSFFIYFYPQEAWADSYAWKDKEIVKVPRRNMDGSTIIRGKSVIVESAYMYTNYGHSIIDSFIPLFVGLNENGMLNTKVNLCVVCHGHNRLMTEKISEFLKVLFNIDQIFILEKDVTVEPYFFENVVFKVKGGTSRLRVSFEKILREKFGFTENNYYRYINNQDNHIKAFVRYVLKRVNLDRKTYPLVQRRVLMVDKNPKTKDRVIKNSDELERVLLSHGFEVVRVDFEKLPIIDQIKQTMQAEIFLSSHGAALTNAIFLDPRGYVAILWPKNAKILLKRWHCNIMNAFLANGIGLIEYDKPDYDYSDEYVLLKKFNDPDFYIKDQNIIRLKDEYKNFDLLFPEFSRRLKDFRMYQYMVNFSVNPEEVVQLIEDVKAGRY